MMYKDALRPLFRVAFGLTILTLGACAAMPPKTVTGLLTPESVVSAKDGRIFVSEIAGFGKDGDGQISLVDTKGNKQIFASGMDDPKGLAIIGDILYVADKTRVLKVSPDGKWKEFIPASAFPEPPIFLNDLEADTLGNLYISDSGDVLNNKGGGAIYRITPQGEVQTVITSVDGRIVSPNGLLMDDTGEVLLEVDFATGKLYSLNMQTNTLTELAEGFGGGDGLVHHPNGVMYVSDWKNGKLFSVMHDEVKLVREGFKAAADIGLTVDQRYIMVPDMKAGELHFVPVPK